MTPRQARLMDVADQIERQAEDLEAGWPSSALDDPMIGEDKKAVVRARRRDAVELRFAAATLRLIAEDPEAYHRFATLRIRKRWAFDACGEYARQELERQEDAPAEEPRAA